MHHHLKRALVSIGLALCMAVVALATAGGASAAATNTVGLWNFNERSGPAIDSAGSQQNGTVGRLVQRTGSVYRFPTSTSLPAADHLVLVGNNAQFNPGSGEFAVTVRFKTTRAASNVVQKGQATTSGGYWKVEIHNGQATCLFKGGNGQQRSVLSTSRVNNGAFHTVRCDRSSSAVSITVDGVKQRTITGASGNVANGLTMAIGGKAGCNPPRVGCDFFAGDIDYVRIQR
jgi:Laminin G domain